MSGTDMVVPAYGCLPMDVWALRCPLLTYRYCLRACYGMSGTELAYGATGTSLKEEEEKEREAVAVQHRTKTIQAYAPLSAYAPSTPCPVL
eukprot:948082-Rhodomonas_salina.1